MKRLEVGLGLRPQHYDTILQTRPQVSWFEALSENYMGLEGLGGLGGRQLDILRRIRRDYPIVFHGVSMSIGSADELDQRYLARLKELIRVIEPEWVSDHLAWTGVSGENLHDLIPVPYTEEALAHVARKVHEAQEFLGRPLVLENPSSYLSYTHSEMSEWEFLTELGRRTDCLFLLDVNNVYVSSVNLGFSAETYLRGVPRDRVAQIHLAGHSTGPGRLLLIDTHDHAVSDAVWDLYRRALALWGRRPTLIEWDDQVPEFSVLEAEAAKALSYYYQTELQPCPA